MESFNYDFDTDKHLLLKVRGKFFRLNMLFRDEETVIDPDAFDMIYSS